MLMFRTRPSRFRTFMIASLTLAMVPLAQPALAQRGTEPRRSANETDALPRSLTEREREIVREAPLHLLRGATDPPEGPIVCPPEYHPTQAIIMSYTGNGSWKDILDAMAARITNNANTEVWVICPSSAGGCAAEVQQYMVGIAGANPAKVRVYSAPLNSIWVRDYGPRYIYEGNVRAIVDHTYNRPRPLDNAIPAFISGVRNHAYYELPLVHGGGNYHLDDDGLGYSTVLIQNENPGLTLPQIRGIWQAYQNLFTLFYDAFPTNVDATQHIDMWMIPVAHNKVIISEWPAQPGSIQAQICNAAAADFASRGYTVYRTPARTVSGTHYTYTNAVIVNNIVLVPSYTNSTASQYNATALAVWQQALPDKTIYQINCQAIVTAAGVMHCIVKHVPAPLGGAIPTAFLRSPRGGESLNPGDQLEIRWSSDDDIGVTNVDLHLSTDGGATYPHVIALATADDGSFVWTVPDLPTSQARVRVIARDADGNTGSDASPANFTITGQTCDFADLNCDGAVDVLDLLILLGSWGSCSGCDADLNGDNVVDVLDLLILLGNWG